jgi:cell division septum initiation protein DivIVA
MIRRFEGAGPDGAEAIEAFLGRVRRRWIALAVLSGLARALATSGLVLVASAAALAWGGPSGPAALVVAIATLATLAVVAGWFVARLRRWPDERRVARLVEERVPELEDRLATAVEVRQERSPARGARAFAELVVADAATHVSRIAPASVLPASALKRAAIELALAAGVVAVGAGVAVEPRGRAAGLALATLYPERVRLVVQPGDARVAAGAPLRITATVTGLRGQRGRAAPILRRTVRGATTVLPMAPAGDGFAVELAKVDESFTYTVAAGDVSSPPFTVTVLRPPRVVRIDLDYEYPASTGLRPRHEADAGDIYAPAGTRVRLRIEADAPVGSGTLVLAGGERRRLASAGPRVVTGALTVEADTSYRVALADPSGLVGDGGTEYFVRVVEDRPPDVRVLRPAGDRQVTPLEEVVIEARAEDDYGVDRFELVYAVRGRESRAVPLRGGGAATARTGSHVIYLEDLGVAPGDFVAYYVRARDVGRFRRPVESRSDLYFLDVVPFEEAFEAAESAAAGGAEERSLERLIRAQKDVVSATWSLDRRRTGGQSAPDVLAVARAQGELRRQTEAMRGVTRALGRTAGAREGGEARADPLGRAAGAMARAQAALEALDTSGALPHEMEALNELLRAQSEVRRRQVVRQAQAGAGAGTGRQQYDLSSLFDRELQRQQRSSYEMRPPTRAPDPERPDDPLKAIEELARRQNDVNRQLDALASEDAAARERERALERLAREQEELRRRAEDLVQQLARGTAAGARRAGQPSRSPQEAWAGAGWSPSGGEGSRGSPGGRSATAEGRQAREAADAMRRAAGELQRRAIDAARARGAEAAGALEALGRVIRAREPDETIRALADELGRARAARERLDEAARRLEERLGAGRAGGRRAGEGTDPEAMARLARELAEAVREAQQLVNRVRVSGDNAGRGPTPQAHEYTMGAPGTEAFKQDYARWDALRRGVASALERHELAVSAELARRLAAGRLQADALADIPEEYRALVARYYLALAKRP